MNVSIDIFKNRNFSLLLLSQLITWIGNGVHQVAFNFYLYDVTGSAVVVGNSLIFAFLPTLIFAPIIGTLVDNMPKKNILIFSDIVRGLILLTIPVISLNIHFMYLIQFLLAVFSMMFSIAQKSTTGDILDEKHFLQGNGLLSSIKSFVKIFSPALAGVMISLMHIKIIFIFNAMTFIISAIFIMLMTLNTQIATKKGKQNFIQLIKKVKYKETLSFIFINNNMKKLFINNIYLNVLAGANNVLIIIWVTNSLNGGSKEYGFLTSSLALGLFLGSILMSNSNKSKLNLLFYRNVSIILGLTFALFALCSSIYLAAILRVVIGAGFVVLTILTNSLFQTFIPKESYGSIFSLIEVTDNSLNIFSIIIFGLLAEITSSKLLLIGAGLSFTILIILSDVLIRTIANKEQLATRI